MKPRILFVSDDSRLNTGFARVVREIIWHFQSTGKYELFQHAWFTNTKPQHKVTIPIFPTKKHPKGGLDSNDLYGQQSFSQVASHIQPNIVFALGDPNMILATTSSELRNTYTLIAYVPVDNFHVAKDWEPILSKIDFLYLFCPWAERVIRNRLPSVKVAGTVPHGIDTDIYKPFSLENKAKVRMALTIKPDQFVLGFAGRNLERKRIDQLIMLASHLRHGTYIVQSNGKCRAMTFDRDGNLCDPRGGGVPAEKKDVIVYLHTSMKDTAGPCLQHTIDMFNMRKFVYCDPSYEVAKGVTDQHLSAIYNAMDVFVSFASGGWELTDGEAMSCGIPMVRGNFAATPDFCSPGALLVDPIAWYADMRNGIIRPIPDMNQAIELTRLIMNNKKVAQGLSERGRKQALTLTWKTATKQWETIVDNAITNRTTSPFMEI